MIDISSCHYVVIFRNLTKFLIRNNLALRPTQRKCVMRYVTATLGFKETPIPEYGKFYEQLRRLGWVQAPGLEAVWTKEYSALVPICELDTLVGKDFFEATQVSLPPSYEYRQSISAYPSIPATISRE